jgi:heptosyltransferase-2
LIFQTSTLEALRIRTFDIVLNLEKDFSLCILTNEIKAKQKLGFYYDDRCHEIATRKRSTQYLLSGQENQREINKNAFELLYETAGKKWEGQGVVLGVAPKKRYQFDIGFNYAVGSKWPTKAWPERYWKILEKLLDKEFTISWQQGHKNLRRYIDWINNCRMIITNDSLGQAIAQGLGKQVITLYGPTNPCRMGGIKNVHILTATLDCSYMPCFMPVCQNSKFCMDYISPERVANKVRELCQ